MQFAYALSSPDSILVFDFLTRFTVCLIFPIKKFSSNVDSVSEVSKSDITISDSTLPKCCIFDVCLSGLVSLCKSTSSRFRLLTYVKVSIMANVTFNALLLFRIVASIYNPFSVKTFGSILLLEETFVVENFDRKISDSSDDKTNI